MTSATERSSMVPAAASARIIASDVRRGPGRGSGEEWGPGSGGCARSGSSGSSMSDTGGSQDEVTKVPALSGGCGGRGVSGDPPAGGAVVQHRQTTPRYG